MVATATDSLAFEHTHTSGMIAWAPEDQPTNAQIEAVLDKFEQTAWAGLEPETRRMSYLEAAAAAALAHP